LVVVGVVRGADGHDYVIEVGPAKKVSLWSHGPWRWKASLTRDQSTWLTVERDDVGWPLLRERLDSAERAAARAADVEERLRSGDWRPTVKPALRRTPPKVGALSLFALAHPFVLALASGAFLCFWGFVIDLPTSEAVAGGVLMALIQLVIWFPCYGPGRRYTERLLASRRGAHDDTRDR